MAEKRRVRRVAGIALILIGALAMARGLIEWERYDYLLLPGAAVLFLAWGIFTRRAGPLVPGCVLSGIWAGLQLAEGRLDSVEDMARTGVFLLAFAGGWLLITLLSSVFTAKTHWWPVIPGGILGVVGAAAFFFGGGATPEVQALIQRFWPVALIATGLFILLKRR